MMDMSDNLANRGPQDRSRINVHEQHEVACYAASRAMPRECPARR